MTTQPETPGSCASCASSQRWEQSAARTWKGGCWGCRRQCWHLGRSLGGNWDFSWEHGKKTWCFKENAWNIIWTMEIWMEDILRWCDTEMGIIKIYKATTHGRKWGFFWCSMVCDAGNLGWFGWSWKRGHCEASVFPECAVSVDYRSSISKHWLLCFDVFCSCLNAFLFYVSLYL